MWWEIRYVTAVCVCVRNHVQGSHFQSTSLNQFIVASTICKFDLHAIASSAVCWCCCICHHMMHRKRNAKSQSEEHFYFRSLINYREFRSEKILKLKSDFVFADFVSRVELLSMQGQAVIAATRSSLAPRSNFNCSPPTSFLGNRSCAAKRKVLRRFIFIFPFLMNVGVVSDSSSSIHRRSELYLFPCVHRRAKKIPRLSVRLGSMPPQPTPGDDDRRRGDDDENSQRNCGEPSKNVN